MFFNHAQASPSGEAQLASTVFAFINFRIGTIEIIVEITKKKLLKPLKKPGT